MNTSSKLIVYFLDATGAAVNERIETKGGWTYRRARDMMDVVRERTRTWLGFASLTRSRCSSTPVNTHPPSHPPTMALLPKSESITHPRTTAPRTPRPPPTPHPCPTPHRPRTSSYPHTSTTSRRDHASRSPAPPPSSPSPTTRRSTTPTNSRTTVSASATCPRGSPPKAPRSPSAPSRAPRGRTA